MNNYKMAILKEDGTHDNRYTYGCERGLYIPLFCGLSIGKASSIHNAVLCAKRHQTRQVLSACA